MKEKIIISCIIIDIWHKYKIVCYQIRKVKLQIQLGVEENCKMNIPEIATMVFKRSFQIT